MNPTKSVPITVAELAKSSDALRRIFRYGIMLPLLVAALAGCGKSEKKPPPQPGNTATATTTTWPATQKTDRGNFTVTLQPSDGGIERGRHFSLELTIDASNGADDAAASGLEVTVDADMPAHRHGMNTQPELIAEGDRRYRANGMLFHMAGDWVISVEIARGAESERVSFPVHVE